MDKLKVVAIRANLGLSQKEFAKMLDIPLSTYQLKEQGKSPWKYKEIVRIAEIAQINISMIDA